jgi:hypothetical protein
MTRVYYQHMSETQSRKVGAYVTKNTPLTMLYTIGALAIVGGAIIAIAASANAVSAGDLISGPSVSTVAMAWQVIGNGLVSLGALALIGGAVAHAINWQILNRS